jgi:hypothetical protein
LDQADRTLLRKLFTTTTKQATNIIQLDILVVGPHGGVAVDEVCQVVLDEVLARHAAVHRVPVTELSPQLVQGGLRDAALVGVLVRLAVNVVPHFQCQLLRPVKERDTQTVN